MSQSATKEYAGRTRFRYQGMKTRKAKGRVLDEFCATTGYERKHAIKLMNGLAGNTFLWPVMKSIAGNKSFEKK